MTITTPNNNGQLARWLNRKGDLCFEIAFFATAAISFVALGAFIIALSLVVGGLLVAGVILFCAADMMSEKVNKVATRQQIQAQTKEMMKQKGTIKQEGATEQDDVQKNYDDAQKKDDDIMEKGDDTQNKDGPKKQKTKKKKKQKTTQTRPSETQTMEYGALLDRERRIYLDSVRGGAEDGL
ncbi:hypothetical protein CGCF415_v006746 [Colletotrichum fructicola]|uniref:Uncharacterized protein n=1 Tax=Colletotrichum fructicola (strain Nara gc5) TaxID=1213859 RepID=L2FPU6_COLFN|nr:uncharacterized protein CGMCC3_g1611 [Colletotrichum fructicola]KAF4485208.1 hypothetical protein CGGC5_v008341 [Colletotrichum fructicola Nara gc5]KAE9582434.1 hypothetical protein CGMCC3_g1611 [Colletotrichum fructicola]KAF4431217.1 hypothetical protein CFRS1_v008776 [Colletotrichum fructicola]KAF4881593.1 hypothetical protein CGCFRS4_v015407 [Colletotrichum fructicola]KAF4908203.1 hypothetical protein CGCF415_v006746 [Colletotrichum fructicola]